MSTRKRGWFRFLGKELQDPTTNLFESAAFKLAIAVPVILAVIFVTVASLKSGMSLDLSAEGLSVFYQYFKFPLAVASLSIPCAALVASHLRSLQTSVQIQQQAQQDKFSNFISHRDLFMEVFENLNLFKNGKSKKGAAMLYIRLFPMAKQGDFRVGDEIIAFAQKVEAFCDEYKHQASISRHDLSNMTMIFVQIFSLFEHFIAAFEEPKSENRTSVNYHIAWAKEAISFLEDLRLATNFVEHSRIDDKLSNSIDSLSEGIVLLDDHRSAFFNIS
jgi:hypothetical protein